MANTPFQRRQRPAIQKAPARTRVEQRRQRRREESARVGAKHKCPKCRIRVETARTCPQCNAELGSASVTVTAQTLSIETSSGPIEIVTMSERVMRADEVRAWIKRQLLAAAKDL